MFSCKEIEYKIYSRLHRIIVLSQRKKKYYYFFYNSFWHMIFSKNSTSNTKIQYITARPNPGAGIGHQISNWISGYSLAKMWNMKYAYIPFSYEEKPFMPNEWDSLLGFAQGEERVDQLLKMGYKKVFLPMFDEHDLDEVNKIKRIISSYTDKRIFILEQDQKINNDLWCIDILRRKYRNSNCFRERPKYEQDVINIAIHVRRGDIVQLGDKKNANLTMRWLDDDYYIRIIDSIVEVIGEHKYMLYLCSQGEKATFKNYLKFKNMKLCTDLSAIQTFRLLTDADILIMSRSGFSYQAAKLNNHGIIIYPFGFWHDVFDNKRTLIPDSFGNIKIEDLKKLLDTGIRFI